MPWYQERLLFRHFANGIAKDIRVLMYDDLYLTYNNTIAATVNTHCGIS